MAKHVTSPLVGPRFDVDDETGVARPRPKRTVTARQSQGSTHASHAPTSPIGIDESELWAMADALRGSMDAAEYKHVVLGLIFLKYISDAFEERHAAVLAE